MAYEVKTLTWASPRYYDKAFALVSTFEKSASAEDYDALLVLRDEMETERDAYFLDRMQQARWHWERSLKSHDSREGGRAVGELVKLIMYIGDEQMAAQAAKDMLVLEGIDGWLRGYHKDRPDQFQILVREPSVRDAAMKEGLL